MDSRWTASPLSVARNTSIILHPTSNIRDVRLGVSTDGVDLSKNVSKATHTSAEASITLDWNNEFLGDNQPKYGNILEIQEDGQPLWIGMVWNITGYQVSFGKRQMQIIARNRETFDIWKLTKLVTKLYPQGTNILQIVQDIGYQVGLYTDEMLLPSSTIQTAHVNTQLANLSAWEMIISLMLPLGYTPFFNSVGILKGMSRETQNRTTDITITQDRLLSVNASRNRPSTTRVIVQWLDPNLTKVTQLPRKLAEQTMTSGWFLPYLRKHVWFSADNTQRAENTYMIVRQSANALLIPVCLENYSQTSETEGMIEIITLGYTQAILALIFFLKAIAANPDYATLVGPTTRVGTFISNYGTAAVFLVMASIGTGIYEVWGTPYDFSHTRNTTEAFDQSAVPWLDNPYTISNDFITGEPHADDVAVRELFYLSNAANTWDITIVEDRRIEKGDILGLPDGSQLYVTEIQREVGFEAENKLNVSGFLI